jgi:hypothetical protein
LGGISRWGSISNSWAGHISHHERLELELDWIAIGMRIGIAIAKGIMHTGDGTWLGDMRAYACVHDDG